MTQFCVAVVLAAAIAASIYPTRGPPPPLALEPAPGVAQCNYELLRAFAGWVDAHGLRYTLAAGTLLGAMRNEPPGLLQWEHDVDVYMPARDASELVALLARDCGSASEASWQSRWCAVLEARGLVDREGAPCCGFGFKLFHRTSAACELDVLVLAAAPAPFAHGETRWWPPWAPYTAHSWQWAASRWYRRRFYVIPEDIDRKALLVDAARWCRDDAEWAWCGGPPLSYFQDEYFEEEELFPARVLRFYDVDVRVPRLPWALLERAYGAHCRHIARVDEHGGGEVDLRDPAHARFLQPAAVRLSAESGGGHGCRPSEDGPGRC